MRRLKVMAVIAFMMGFILSQPCWAGEKKALESEAPELKEIVVTATKTEKTLEQVPGSVTVITKEEMKRKHIRTVDDALNSLPGIFVKRSKGLMDSTATVRMRGFALNRYVQVLIDGQPINDAYTGGLQWGSLPVENIERIEVVRGAASALYGGNAMGGVINIITKTPQKLELEANGGYGTHDTHLSHIYAGDRFWDHLSIGVGYERESTDGYPTIPVRRRIKSGRGDVTGGYPMNDMYGKPRYWVVGDKGDNGAERHSTNGKLSLDFSDTGNLSFTAVSSRWEYYYGPPHTYMGTFKGSAIAGPNKCAKFRPHDFIGWTGFGRRDNDIYTLAFKDLFGPVEVNAQIGTVHMDDRYTLATGWSGNYSNSPGSLKITHGRTWTGELRGNLPLGQSHLLTLGVSFRHDDADTDEYKIPFYRSFNGRGQSTFYSGGKSKNWAVFGQDEWHIIDPLTLYLGLRYDSWRVYDGASGKPGSETEYDSNTESELSPKVAAVWKPLSDTTLRASVGHAFRPPNIYELYRTWYFWGTTYQCNPKLDPETMWAYELGIEQYLFNKKTRLSLTGYRNDIKDLIYYRTQGRTKIRTNVGKARTYGLEVEASQKVTDWLTIWGNYTYTHAEITDNPADPDSEDKQMIGIPKNTFNLGIDTQYKCVKASVVGRYFSKIYNRTDNRDKEEGVYGTYEPAFVADAKVTVNPTKWMEISLSVDNIFDEKDYEYYRTDGRTYFAELRVKY